MIHRKKKSSDISGGTLQKKSFNKFTKGITGRIPEETSEGFFRKISYRISEVSTQKFLYYLLKFLKEILQKKKESRETFLENHLTN